MPKSVVTLCKTYDPPKAIILASMAHDHKQVSPPSPAEFLLFYLTAGLAAALLTAGVEWPIYQEVLNPTGSLHTSQQLLLVWSIWAKTMLLAGPIWVLCLLGLRSGRPHRGWVGFVCGTAAVFTLITLDLLVYRTHGQHLARLAHFIGYAQASEYVGDATSWIKTLVVTAAGALFGLSLLAWIVPAALRNKFATGDPPRLRRLSRQTALLMGVAVCMPLALRNYLGEDLLFERIIAVFPVDPRPADSLYGPIERGDPMLSELDQQFKELYRREFVNVSYPYPPDESAVFDGRDAPNVVILVLESLNARTVMEGVMPKLLRHAQYGMVFHRHYSGSNHSEPGLFSLLYSRSPWFYYPTIEAHITPQACVSFKKSGYMTGYFSGMAGSMYNLEEMFNARFFDHYEQHAPPTRNEWDLQAMANLRRFAQNAEEHPAFAFGFLQSSHFSYEYPPQYADHPAGKLNPHRYPPDQYTQDQLENLANYHRCLAFLDDEIDKLVTSLGTSKTIFVVTGDHGESLYEDGKIGHLYGFCDSQTRVPLFIFGAGVPAMQTHTLTSHADILPTLLHLAGGRPTPIARSIGRDLTTPPTDNRGMLFSVNYDGKLSALVIQGNNRLSFAASSSKPLLRLQGFEDTLGHPLLSTSNISPESLTRLVEEHLRLITGGSPPPDVIHSLGQGANP